MAESVESTSFAESAGAVSGVRTVRKISCAVGLRRVDPDSVAVPDVCARPTRSEAWSAVRVLPR